MNSHYNLPPFLGVFMVAGAAVVWVVLILLYWPFAHKALAKTKGKAFIAALIIQTVCPIAEMLLYNTFGSAWFPEAMDLSKQGPSQLLWYESMVVVSTALSAVVLLKFNWKCLLWLLAGHQLAALLVMKIFAGVEM